MMNVSWKDKTSNHKALTKLAVLRAALHGCIIHQLSTSGDMDFEDIGHVVYLVRVKGSMKEREERCMSTFAASLTNASESCIYNALNIMH